MIISLTVATKPWVREGASASFPSDGLAMPIARKAGNQVTGRATIAITDRGTLHWNTTAFSKFTATWESKPMTTWSQRKEGEHGPRSRISDASSLARLLEDALTSGNLTPNPFPKEGSLVKPIHQLSQKLAFGV
jgi:hypothetical protein